MAISKATEKNWKRLNIKNPDDKLQMRANKLNSKKYIIPKEYQGDKNNAKRIVFFIEEVKKNYKIKDIIYSFALSYLLNKNLIELRSKDKIHSNNNNLLDILNAFNGELIDDVIRFDLKEYDFDILGFIYQVLLIEGEKSKNGIYYTPKRLTSLMLNNVKTDENLKILDPACGTGSFLINIQTDYPENLYGYDIDETAVFIAQVNLINKHADKDFYPNIFAMNFLELNNFELKRIPKFDYIITNPPWGNKADIHNEDLSNQINTREFFSYFLIQSSKVFNGNGQCIFLLPESFLKVNVHSQIRKFLFDKYSIDEIHELGQQFTSVLSNVIMLKFSSSTNNKIMVNNGDSYFELNKNDALSNEYFQVNLYKADEKNILNKLDSKKMYDLTASKWALGIVTGNNKMHIKNIQNQGMERIYTGKEIKKYKLSESNKYIFYKREFFQQVAKDSIYRADEKLIYKFISNKLQFAYDNKQRLFLNSANILIPEIPSMSVKTVLGFLNSRVFQFYFQKRYGQIKVLKSHLKNLPFPQITEEDDIKIQNLVNKIIQDETDDECLNKYIYTIFNLTSDEVTIIEESIK